MLILKENHIFNFFCVLPISSTPPANLGCISLTGSLTYQSISVYCTYLSSNLMYHGRDIEQTFATGGLEEPGEGERRAESILGSVEPLEERVGAYSSGCNLEPDHFT